MTGKLRVKPCLNSILPLGSLVRRNGYSLDYLSQFTLNCLVQMEIILIGRCDDLNIRNWPRDKDVGGDLEGEKE